jgi:hypothetical protein
MTRRVAPDPLALSGRTLLDRYVVDAAIAQGGMAVIYRGRDLRLHRPVCIKVFQRVGRSAAGYRTAYEHFVQEAFALSQFNHPNTLRIYDFGYLPAERDEGDEETAPFQISELLEGGTLGQHIRADGPLDGRAALELLIPIAGALAEAHARGIVHRDIKPSNILYGLAGDVRIVKLCDFGIAKCEGGVPNRAEDTALTAGPRLRLYSPGWSAPEQIHGAPVGPAADVYALGLVLAYVLTGQPIFSATRPDEALAERIESDAHIARFLEITGVREALAAVVRGACRERVEDRHGGVRPLIDALRAAVEMPDEDSLVTRPLGRMMMIAPSAPELDPSPDATPTPRLVVDPHGDGEVLVAGRRMRLVPMASGDQIDVGGDGPVLRSPARFRITLTPSSGALPRLHVKGLNCFVARVGARPTTAVDVETDMDVNLLAPDRRTLDGVRCTLGRDGVDGRLYDLGHVTLAVPPEASAILLDLGPGRELALLHCSRVARTTTARRTR